MPKIIHFIWIGSNPKPKSFVDHYQKQWTDAHPDFVFKMWCEDNLSAEDFINKEIILD